MLFLSLSLSLSLSLTHTHTHTHTRRTHASKHNRHNRSCQRSSTALGTPEATLMPEGGGRGGQAMSPTDGNRHEFATLSVKCVIPKSRKRSVSCVKKRKKVPKALKSNCDLFISLKSALYWIVSLKSFCILISLSQIILSIHFSLSNHSVYFFSTQKRPVSYIAR